MEKRWTAHGGPMAKPLALLIPGLDGTGKLYYRQIEGLSARYRVRAWAYPREDSFDLADLVEAIAEATSAEEPMLVIAESFGGLVALRLALDYPERIRQLCLINTFPFYRRRVRIRLGCALARFLELPLARGVKDFVVERTLAAEGIAAEDRARYRQAIRTVYRPAYCRRLELVRDVDLRNRLGEIKVPTFLFASGRDKLVPSIREARRMHALIPGSSIREFPNAGHSLLLTPGFNLSDYF